MRILAIETSCDETAVAVVESDGAAFTVTGNALYSQAHLHAPYGGVYPNLAKREHQNNLPALTEEALREAASENGDLAREPQARREIRGPLFSDAADLRETDHAPEKVLGSPVVSSTRRPDFSIARSVSLVVNLDLIAVTSGPGLEPALWTGITFAEELGKKWGVPVVGVDHMEGHIVSALVKPDEVQDLRFKIQEFEFPVLALLISGGHTELVLMREWFRYELVGRTKDDAVGEAFDKVARILGLPYPGGPAIAALAADSRSKIQDSRFKLPRPIINDGTCDFSFSGLKTAVLYLVRDLGTLTDEDRAAIAREFEDAARDVMVAKSRHALTETGAKTLAVGGGVAANAHIREGLERLVEGEFPGTRLLYPSYSLTGDNAVMIGVAAALRAAHGAETPKAPLTAKGSQSLVDSHVLEKI